MMQIKVKEFKNKDKLVLAFNEGEFYLGGNLIRRGVNVKLPYIEVKYGSYNESPYSISEEKMQGPYFEITFGAYFPISKMDEALKLFDLLDRYYNKFVHNSDYPGNMVNPERAEMKDEIKKFGYSMEEVNQMNVEYLGG